MRRDWDRVEDTLVAWRLLVRTDSLKNDTRLAVLIMMVMAYTLAWNDVVADARDVTNSNMIVKESPKGAPNSSGIAPRCAVLVCEYTNGRDAQAFDVSVRDDTT